MEKIPHKLPGSCEIWPSFKLLWWFTGKSVMGAKLVGLCLFPHEERNLFHSATGVLFHFPSHTLNIEMNIYQAELFPKLWYHGSWTGKGAVHLHMTTKRDPVSQAVPMMAITLLTYPKISILLLDSKRPCLSLPHLELPFLSLKAFSAKSRRKALWLLPSLTHTESEHHQREPLI